ncbi:MAG: TonB-dependent receptor [Melioribacteraceae bacterium]|nr:TonB-dependent receptor [Melioribacteraceae bacterium]
MKLSILNFFLSLFLLISISSNLLAQTGNVSGVVTDATDRSPLLGANIIVSGTSIGTTTDRDGKYRLVRLNEGRTLILFMYLGYDTDSVWVNVASDRTVSVDVTLKPKVILGQEVVVTGQLQGQAAAINQQLSSNTIINVVSKDRIQELPDQNAAESVGRLPGISVERNAGEGTKVIVRGLAAKFNSVTINGQRIPSTDPQNRSVDLSMISSDMLAGIEVFKALTPDHDGDAVGGKVNFEIKKAPEGFNTNIRAQGTYNSQEKDYGNYRGSFTLSNRYLDNKLGIVATGSLQRANRGSDLLDAAYLFAREALPGEKHARITVENLNLGDRVETRDRYGASVVVDYNLGNGELLFSSLYGRTDRDEVRNRKRYRVDNAYVEYWLRSREIGIDLFTNSLSGKHNFSSMKLEWQASYSYSKYNMPFMHDSQFREVGAYLGTLVTDKGPEIIPLGAKNNLDQTRFYQDFFNREMTKDRDYTAQFDLTIPYSLTSDLTGNLKVGGKYRDKNRSLDKEEWMTLAFKIDQIGKNNPTLFNTTGEGYIKINNFYDDDYDIGEFLNGKYVFGPAKALSRQKIDNFMNTYWTDYTRNYGKDLEDYSAGEAITAGYVMAELNIGPRLMILPGFRYEGTTTNYKSVFGQARVDERGIVTLEGATDTVGTVSYNELLPMVHIRYKFTDWFDTRIAITKSLARPDYFNLVPWERISYFDGTVERGEPFLKHTKVWNYDIFFSFYGNYGLFTVGAYYKSLKDIEYIRVSRVTEAGSTLGFTLTKPENSKYETKVYGLEFEVQTNLRFLPSPFDGIVISANYSYIHSITHFPFLKVGPRNPMPPFNFTFIDTAREARMPGQANHLANFTFGYEKGKFSGRISMIYQGDALQTIGTRAELDGYSDDFVRWDLALQYKVLPKLAVTFNMNNLSNLPEGAFLGIETFATREEYFGWTADLGIRFDL